MDDAGRADVDRVQYVSAEVDLGSGTTNTDEARSPVPQVSVVVATFWFHNS